MIESWFVSLNDSSKNELQTRQACLFKRWRSRDIWVISSMSLGIKCQRLDKVRSVGIEVQLGTTLSHPQWRPSNDSKNMLPSDKVRLARDYWLWPRCRENGKHLVNRSSGIIKAVGTSKATMHDTAVLQCHSSSKVTGKDADNFHRWQYWNCSIRP